MPAGIGSLLILSMKREGYDSSFAVTVMVCSSVMGMFIDAIPVLITLGTVLLPLAEDAGMYPNSFCHDWRDRVGI
ncbi:MAG: hypothetical protein M2R45_02402 [Verrucomicrobia subdivision 3 bacterium]|nr:hypothetical protein [Limisphaerales bacterium]MCS1416392.1 hypothetical protein [Limisphaerales bacterium]